MPEHADPVLGEYSGGLVSQLYRDVKNRIAGVAEVAEASEDFSANHQPLGRAKLGRVEISIDADDGDACLHGQIEGAGIPMRGLEEILDRNRQLAGEMAEPVPQGLEHIVGEGIALYPLHPLPEPLRTVVEAVEHHLFQPQAAQLGHGIELGGVERDVSDQWKRRVSLEQAGNRADVHDTIGGGIEDDDVNGLPADERLELLPGGCDQKLGLVSENVSDVGEEPRGQERCNAHWAIARMDRKVAYKPLPREGK